MSTYSAHDIKTHAGRKFVTYGNAPDGNNYIISAELDKGQRAEKDKDFALPQRIIVVLSPTRQSYAAGPLDLVGMHLPSHLFQYSNHKPPRLRQ